MNFIRNYIKQKKLKEALNLREMEEYLYQQKVEAYKKVDTSTDHMTSKFCPIIKDNCQITCVHFKAGYVTEWEFYDLPRIDYKLARCRLWNNY